MKTAFLLPHHELLGYGQRGLLLLGLCGLAPAAFAQSSFATHVDYTVASAAGMALGDVNGDGRLDMVTSSLGATGVSVLLGQATAGTFSTATNYSIGSSDSYAVTLGDVNADGRLDIVVSSYNGGSANKVSVLLNSAATPGTFLAATSYNTGGTGGTLGVAVGDINGDGRPDIAALNYGSGTVGILLGSATTPGTFGAAVGYATGGSSPFFLKLGDMNGDGRLDVVAANNSSNNVSVLLGSATTPGTLLPAVVYSSGGSNPYGVALGDVNGDGQLDIATTNFGSNNVAVLLGSATTPGTFGAATTYASTGANPVNVALGDVNGDSRLDIVATNYQSALVSVLPATGAAGTFGAAALYATGSSGTLGVALGDVNNDGRLDITTSNNNSSNTSVLLNTLVITDLVVSTTSTIPAGTYNSITVTGTGNGTLGGNVTVTSAVIVQSGGTLNDGCAVISGAGSFTLAAGATLGICAAQGITSSGATGAVQTTGTRLFSPDASYVYNGTAVQATGTGLPTTVRNLSMTNNSNVTLSAPTGVTQVVTIGAAGSLVANGNLTLLSSASATALVVNSGTGSVSGNTTVQRYIDPSLNPGLGYRHLSSPVSGSTVADLTTGTFTPEVSQASGYNTSATPGTTTPFPTVFAYDQDRVTLANSYAPFDRGFVVPTSTSTPLAQGSGYTVNLAGGQVVDFVGVPTNGSGAFTLPRTSGPDAGWHLLGNPYPAPLDYSLVVAADRVGFDASMYVYSSTTQYTGTYRAYINGVGGNPVLPLGQAFFVRVSAGQTSGTFTFRNSQRLTAPDNTPLQRPTADPRPLVQLELRGSTGPVDACYAYAETGATPGTDAEFDAVKLPNPTGLNLSSVAATGEALAIDGRPAFTAATVLPLIVGVPAAGTYALRAATLRNLPTGLDAYLADDQTGQVLKLSTGTSYSFSVTAAQAATAVSGRFRLSFRPATALATVPSLTAETVGVYPNPAHERFTVTLPGLAQATTVQAELLNTLGQVVRRQSAALPATGTQFTLETAGLATGVYTLRMQAGATTLAKRVVIQ